MALSTLRQLFERMPDAFQADAARGLTAAYQFDLGGEGAAKWYVAILDGALTVAEGEHPAPDVTVLASAQDYLAIADGRMSQMLAFAAGKLTLRGDLGLAMKLPQLFRR